MQQNLTDVGEAFLFSVLDVHVVVPARLGQLSFELGRVNVMVLKILSNGCPVIFILLIRFLCVFQSHTHLSPSNSKSDEVMLEQFARSHRNRIFSDVDRTDLND